MQMPKLFLAFLFIAASSHAANPSGEWHSYGEGWPYTYLKIETNGSAVLAFFNPDKEEDSLNPLVFQASSGALRWVDGTYLIKFCSSDCEKLYGTLVFTTPGAPVDPGGFIAGNFFRYSNWRGKGTEYLQYFPVNLSVKDRDPIKAFTSLENSVANKQRNTDSGADAPSPVR